MTAEPIFPKELVAAVGYRFGATTADMLGPRRLKPLVYARATVAFILFERGHSLCKIGRILNRDHSSIVHYLRALDTNYRMDPVFGPLINEITNWRMNGRKTLDIYRKHLAEEKICKHVLQPIEEVPQQRRSTEMLHPEETEKQIAEALKAEKLRDIEVIWDGDIICRGEPAVFDVYRDDEETNLFVRDHGPRLTLYRIENRCTYEVGDATSCAKLAALLREAVNTKEAA